MNGILNDIRYSLRQLRKAPGFALTAILTLAFGIGATTAIFSIVEGVLLRPLPFSDPSSLVAVGDLIDGTPMNGPSATAPELAAYAEGTTGFSSLGGCEQTGYELSGAGEPAQINASRLAASTFPTLGVSPILGRTFTRQEDESSQPVAVLSYSMWRSRFHGDEQVLGKKILLDRKPYEVIGVMPREFEFPLVPGQLNRSELWVPMSLTPGEIAAGSSSWNFQMVGRLKPGITAAAAQQQAQHVPDEIMRRFPELAGNVHMRATVQPLNEATVAQARPLVRMLFLAVAVVLFIACANLAGLLLVRVIGRRREIAVRLALGASGNAVIRQTMVETLTLSVIGGLLGLMLAIVALRVGVSFLPETLPRVSAIGLDWQVVLFAVLLAAVTGILCGLAPSFAASRTGINEGLKEGGRTGTVGGGHARLRSALVITEIAVALVLLTFAGLLLRSFDKLRAVNLGYKTDHLLTAGYSLPQQQYSTQTAVNAFNDALLRKLQLLPGVQAVGMTSLLPGAGRSDGMGFVPEGYNPPKGVTLNLAWPSRIRGSYFEAAGIPILRGREFTEADDREGAPLIAIVNRTLAEKYWPGQDPIGKRLHIGVPSVSLPWMKVVGEIGDIKQESADADILPQLYMQTGQFNTALGQFAKPDMLGGSDGSIVLRTSLPPDQMTNELLSTVRSIDPRLPLTGVESMEKVVQETEAPRRFNTAVISSFAAAAVLLALLGVYGVIAFSAALRTQEMAIRLALGSQRSTVMQIILTSGAKLGLAGCVIGAVGALFTTRLLRTMLFQVDPLDPLVLALAAVSIFLLAIAASVIPARKAAYIEPVQALRGE